MKKKIFSIFTLFVMIFSLAGCMKYNATMEIRDDKSMNFSIIYAMANSLLENSEDQNGSIITEEQKQSLINQGFSINDYKDDKYTGIKITKDYANIDDISSETDTEYSLSDIFEEKATSKLFKVVKGTEKNTYYANFKFNSADGETDDETTQTDQTDDVTIDSSDSTEDNVDLSGLEDMMSSSLDLKFVVKLPSAAISSNATTKSDDGKELTWNLSTNGTETINFQFELNNPVVSSSSNSNSIFNSANMPIIIGIGALFIIIVIVLIVIYLKGNKKDKNTEPVTQPVTHTAEVSVTPTPAVTPAEAPVTPTPEVAPVEVPVTPAVETNQTQSSDSDKNSTII